MYTAALSGVRHQQIFHVPRETFFPLSFVFRSRCMPECSIRERISSRHSCTRIVNCLCFACGYGRGFGPQATIMKSCPRFSDSTGPMALLIVLLLCPWADTAQPTRHAKRELGAALNR